MRAPVQAHACGLGALHHQTAQKLQQPVTPFTGIRPIAHIFIQLCELLERMICLWSKLPAIVLLLLPLLLDLLLLLLLLF